MKSGSFYLIPKISLRFLRCWCRSRDRYVLFFDDRNVGPADPVVRIFHPYLHFDDLSRVEYQLVIRSSIRREPVFAVDVLTPRFHYGEPLIFAFRDSFALGLYDQEIFVVDPDAAGKKLLVQLFWIRNYLRRGLEYIKIQLVDLFLSEIREVIFR